MESNNTAVTDTAEAEAEAVDAPANLSTLTDILDADAAPEGDSGNSEAVGNDAENAKLEMFNDLVESSGLELNDLYKLQVSVGEGETVTIEELKALHSKQDDFVLRELESEETRAAKETALLQAQTELAEIVAALPEGTIKPAILEKMRAKNATRISVEQSRTLDAIPTWKNDDARTQDMTGMAAHLERFGFPSNHLGAIVDHRMLVFIRESFLRETRIRKALERVRAGKPNPTTATKTAGKAPTKTGSAPNSKNARNSLEAFFSDLP